MKKRIKVVIIWIIGILLVTTIGILLFVNLHPAFGGKQDEQSLKRHALSPNFEKDKFINLEPTKLDMSFGNMKSMMLEVMRGIPNRSPKFDIPFNKVDSLALENGNTQTRLIWFGHSAFLLQMDGLNILLDPMFGDVPAPHPWLGSSRYSDGLPIEIEKLPQIDAIIISHDHYDHLDYGSIKRLKAKTRKYFVPLGVGAHFKAWGVDANAIEEHDWWSETSLGNLKLAFAPSRHFSGRSINDQHKTLWGSWIIKGNQDNIYFSGDGGYGPHFKEIGEKYGPFDLALVECGQYNKRWKLIHMMPEESAQAAIDLKAEKMMPIHWGAFTLALHSWTDPVERVMNKANELNMPVLTPRIGEFIYPREELSKRDYWWMQAD